MCNQKSSFQEQFQRQQRKLNDNPEIWRHDQLRQQMQHDWEARQRLKKDERLQLKYYIILAATTCTVVTAIMSCVVLFFFAGR